MCNAFNSQELKNHDHKHDIIHKKHPLHNQRQGIDHGYAINRTRRGWVSVYLIRILCVANTVPYIHQTLCSDVNA